MRKKRLRFRGEDAAPAIASVGVLALLCLYPLFLTDSYHNITITKYLFFVIASASFLALCLIARIATGKSVDLTKLNPKNPSVPYPDIFMLLFLLVSVVSCITSKYTLSALGGEMGRRMGLIMMMALTFAYFFISKFYKLRKCDITAFGCVFIIMCLVALMQNLGFDPLDLLSRVPDTSKKNFVAFLGNINVYSSFVCIGAGLSMFMFCHEEEKSSSIFWLIASAFAYFGLFTANSDGGYLGFVVLFALLAPITAKKRESFEKFLILVFMMFFVAGIFSILRQIRGEDAVQLSFLTKTITNFIFVLAGLVISTIFILIIRLTKVSNSAMIILRKIIIGVLVTGIILIVGAFIYFSWINTTADLGSFENYLRFSDEWGTMRGFVWRHLLIAFERFPIDKKLIGYGEETVAFILQEAFGDESAARAGYYFDNAHNDFIQYLVTLGISGLLSYVLLLVTAIYNCVKSNSMLKKALAFAIIIFVAQSTVNITQPITTPLLFVFIGLTQSSCKEQTN